MIKILILLLFNKFFNKSHVFSQATGNYNNLLTNYLNLLTVGNSLFIFIGLSE